MTTDLGIIHFATMWHELHRDGAIAAARRMTFEMRSKGDLDGADTWLKIVVAIEEMRQQAQARPS